MRLSTEALQLFGSPLDSEAVPEPSPRFPQPVEKFSCPWVQEHTNKKTRRTRNATDMRPIVLKITTTCI